MGAHDQRRVRRDERATFCIRDGRRCKKHQCDVPYATLEKDQKDFAPTTRRPPPGASAHTWTYRTRFRRHAVGWKSQPADKRPKEAISQGKKWTGGGE